jgi:hypothetical protein
MQGKLQASSASPVPNSPAATPSPHRPGHSPVKGTTQPAPRSPSTPLRRILQPGPSTQPPSDPLLHSPLHYTSSPPPKSCPPPKTLTPGFHISSPHPKANSALASPATVVLAAQPDILRRQRPCHLVHTARQVGPRTPSSTESLCPYPAIPSSMPAGNPCTATLGKVHTPNTSNPRGRPSGMHTSNVSSACGTACITPDTSNLYPGLHSTSTHVHDTECAYPSEQWTLLMAAGSSLLQLNRSEHSTQDDAPSSVHASPTGCACQQQGASPVTAPLPRSRGSSVSGGMLGLSDRSVCLETVHEWSALGSTQQELDRGTALGSAETTSSAADCARHATGTRTGGSTDGHKRGVDLPLIDGHSKGAEAGEGAPRLGVASTALPLACGGHRLGRGDSMLRHTPEDAVQTDAWPARKLADIHSGRGGSAVRESKVADPPVLAISVLAPGTPLLAETIDEVPQVIAAPPSAGTNTRLDKHQNKPALRTPVTKELLQSQVTGLMLALDTRIPLETPTPRPGKEGAPTRSARQVPSLEGLAATSSQPRTGVGAMPAAPVGKAAKALRPLQSGPTPTKADIVSSPVPQLAYPLRMPAGQGPVLSQSRASTPQKQVACPNGPKAPGCMAAATFCAATSPQPQQQHELKQTGSQLTNSRIPDRCRDEQRPATLVLSELIAGFMPEAPGAPSSAATPVKNTCPAGVMPLPRMSQGCVIVSTLVSCHLLQRTRQQQRSASKQWALMHTCAQTISKPREFTQCGRTLRTAHPLPAPLDAPKRSRVTPPHHAPRPCPRNPTAPLTPPIRLPHSTMLLCSDMPPRASL